MKLKKNKITTAKNLNSMVFILTTSVLFLALIVLFASGMIGFFATFGFQQKIIHANLRLIAQSAAVEVAEFIKDRFSLMETIAGLINPGVTSVDERQRILGHLLGSEPSFREVLLYNTNRKELDRVSRLSRFNSNGLTNFLEENLFVKTKNQERYISPVFVDNSSSEPIINIAVPVNNVFYEFTGVLAANINLKFMWDLVGEIEVGESGYVFVVDSEGTLIAFKDLSRVLLGENVKNIKSVDEFLNNSFSEPGIKVSAYNGINGKKVIGAFIPLGQPHWAVISEIPESEAYRNFYIIMILSITFLLIVGFSSSLIGVYLSRRLTKPIIKLMETADEIAGGKLDLQAAVEGPNEIACLARSFNSMTNQLRSMIDSLKYRSSYLQTTVEKYVDYMAKIGAGRLDTRLDIPGSKEDDNDPLITLGLQLNNTTGNLQQMITQIHKTTEILKMNEEKLQDYSERLKKSNLELEQFAFTASHDLQEPLRKIHFYSEQLIKQYENILDEKAINYIKRMSNAVIRMENFIRDLLQFSRVTSSTKPFEKVDLNNLIREVSDDMEIKIKDTRAVIRIDNLQQIDADPLQMKQLFHNLLSNALKYHKKDVPPVVKISCNVEENESRSPICKISITDNGIGFDSKYIDQIFGLFKRLHGRGAYSGTGIGLAICKKIVEQHNGKITVESTKGAGAVFSVTLPVHQKRTPSADS